MLNLSEKEINREYLVYEEVNPNITYIVILRNKNGSLNRIRRFKNYGKMLDYTDYVDEKLCHLDIQILMKEKISKTRHKTVDITLGVYS